MTSLKCSQSLYKVLFFVSLASAPYLSGCENQVRVSYEPIVTFRTYVQSGGGGLTTVSNANSVVTIYKITKVDNTDKNAQAFTLYASDLFEMGTPNNYYTASGGIVFKMTKDSNFPNNYLFLPAQTVPFPAGKIADYTSNPIEALRFVVVSPISEGKTLEDYKNGYFTPIFYDNSKHGKQGQSAIMYVNKEAKPVYVETLFGDEAYWNQFQ